MEFHPYSFVESLPYMGTGMLGIFVSMGIIILVSILLNKLSKGK